MQVKRLRLDGWKAIAHHLNRERSTVMRWAKERDLPVYRVPGQGSTSVFAYADELDLWFARIRNETQNSDETTPILPNEPNIIFNKNNRVIIISLMAAVAIVIVLFASSLHKTSPKPNHVAPRSPEAAALYIQARDDWASRTPMGLQRAITGFNEVVKREPDFAPAYAGLSDAYLLIREFDATPDSIAYPKAEAAAKRALILDNNSPDAHRALGFIAYWWYRDLATTSAEFNQAIRLDPKNAQSHYWYGNILVDNGQARLGLKALETARLLDPGSSNIQADYGWALWSDGQYQKAKQYLINLRLSDHGSAPITYLGYIALAEQDWVSYLDYGEQRARLRNDGPLLERNRQERAAFDRAGAKGLIDLMAKNTVSDPTAPVSDSSWQALYASLSNDRPKLLNILHQAERQHEVWGLSGVTGPIFKRWQNDQQVAPLLLKRKGIDLKAPQS